MIKAEEYISVLKEEMHETIQKEQRKGKLILPKINIWNLWNILKRNNIQIIGSQKSRKETLGNKFLMGKIITENFCYLNIDKVKQIQEAQSLFCLFKQNKPKEKY